MHGFSALVLIDEIQISKSYRNGVFITGGSIDFRGVVCGEIGQTLYSAGVDSRAGRGSSVSLTIDLEPTYTAPPPLENCIGRMLVSDLGPLSPLDGYPNSIHFKLQIYLPSSEISELLFMRGGEIRVEPIFGMGPDGQIVGVPIGGEVELYISRVHFSATVLEEQ